MLHEFVVTNREAIIGRIEERRSARVHPSASTGQLANGVGRFLSQLSETLRLESTATPYSPSAIGSTAALHGRDLLAMGFNVSQVVHDYGDICQAITELALEQGTPIAVDEFHVLNRCLDTAIAEAVTEHARITAQRTGADEVQRLGQVAHELRNQINTALLAFDILRHAAVNINGSTGMVLARTLAGLRDLVNSTLSEVRLGADIRRPERVPVWEFLDEMAVVGHLHAESRSIHFSVEPGERHWAIDADPQLLESAVMNLLNNAFKFTRRGGAVVLRARADDGRLFIEVEDECGGIPASANDPFRAFGERRGSDRAGLGLGLSIARKAIRAHGGDIHIHNHVGTGCVFAIELPLAKEAQSASAATA